MVDVMAGEGEDWWDETLAETHEVIRKMLDGRIALPALVYVEIK